MKVYIAGPMSGLPDWNFPEFFKAEAVLLCQGHEPFNPAAEDFRKWKNMDGIKANANYRDCLRTDLNYILDQAEAIALLPGWENSKGVQIELALARLLGLQEIYL